MEISQKVDKLHKYESFINDVLKEDLRKHEASLIKINEELNQYYELNATLKHLLQTKNKGESSVKSLMDIGCNFSMEAEVSDFSRIIVHIGLEIYLEFTISDAEKYIEMRCNLLKQHAEEIRTLVAKTKANIKLCLFGIGELEKLNN